LGARVTPLEIEQSMSRVLTHIPPTAKVIMVAIPPGDDTNSLITARLETNQRIMKLCIARETCRFISLEELAATDGRLLQVYDSGDGIHLNANGYEALLHAIRSALRNP
jgi:lysophospholipase L1-like esterase